MFSLLDGEYEITIDGIGDAVPSYEFRLASVTDEAVAINTGVTFTGELTTPSETDFYKFNVNAGDSFYFDVVSTSDQFGAQYRVVSADGAPVFESPSRMVDVDTVTFDQAGEYFLLVEGNVSNQDADTYAINVVPVVSQSEACLLYTSPSPRDATLSRMPSSA